MATAAKTLDSLLESHPGIRGGRLCIAGTRISVLTVFELHKGGARPEDMLERFSTRRPLSLAEIHAALAYCYAHPDEVAVWMQEDRDTDQEVDRLNREALARRLP